MLACLSAVSQSLECTTLAGRLVEVDISGHNAGMFVCCLSISRFPPGWRGSDQEGMPGRPRPTQSWPDTGTEKSSSINSGAPLLTTGHSLLLRVNILNITYIHDTTPRPRQHKYLQRAWDSLPQSSWYLLATVWRAWIQIFVKISA